MSKSLAGVAYSAVRAVQQVGQEGGKIRRKIRQFALPLWFRAHAGVVAWLAWHILQGAQWSSACLDMFTQRDTETQTHRDTHTGSLSHSFSQALSVSGLQKSFGPWPSSRTRACLYSASARSTVLSPGSFRSR